MAELEKTNITGAGVEHDRKRGYIRFDLANGKVATIACTISDKPVEPPDLPLIDADITDEELDEEFNREQAALDAELGSSPADTTLATEEAAHAAADGGAEGGAESGTVKEEGEKPAELKGPLPEDFPGLKALADFDPPVKTYAQLRKAQKDGSWTHIPGIGEATNKQIADRLGLILGE